MTNSTNLKHIYFSCILFHDAWAGMSCMSPAGGGNKCLVWFSLRDLKSQAAGNAHAILARTILVCEISVLFKQWSFDIADSKWIIIHILYIIEYCIYRTVQLHYQNPTISEGPTTMDSMYNDNVWLAQVSCSSTSQFELVGKAVLLAGTPLAKYYST
jgi:hypothetical protein